jgi:uncharacterized protein YegJ (DUF2314 family)
MFKKLFNNLLGNEEAQQVPAFNFRTSYPQMDMDTAIVLAQKTLPDYLKFYAAQPDYAFNHRVKVLFRDHNGGEHIWVTNFDVNGNGITGIIGNEPQIVECVEAGEEVTVPMTDVTDWGFQAGDVQYGNYTVYVLFGTMSQDEVDMYVSRYGFTNNPLANRDATFSDLIKNIDTTPVEYEEGDNNSDGYDPETLHGTHYTPEQFDAEVKKRVDAWVAAEEADYRNNPAGWNAHQFTADGNIKQSEVDSINHNYSREVYMEWNNCDSEQYVRFTMKQRANFVKANAAENPLLEPVHGIDLRTYAAMVKKVTAGVLPGQIQELQSWDSRLDQPLKEASQLAHKYYFDLIDKHMSSEDGVAYVDEEAIEKELEGNLIDRELLDV